MQIDCPGGNMNVLVAGLGSGGSGTICVRGSFISRKDASGAQILVRILNGSVSMMNLPPAFPQQPGDVVVSPVGQQWCARDVPVPGSSLTGVPLTAVAWVLTPSGSGVVASAPQSVWFNGGGSNPTDCCSGCVTGAAAGRVASELANAPALHVTIADGKNAGVHRATLVSFLAWEATIGGVKYQVLGGGEDLLIQGRSSSVASREMDLDPFSAVFPGDVLGAVEDVVVTIA
jgi:hypothetical protein